MLNPFFLQGSKSEQNLIQDLVNEHLKIYGVDVYYLPRHYVTEKQSVIREVVESIFDYAYPLEAYVNNYEGYGNNTTILSKFGIQALNELSITISKERFENYISPLIKNQPNIKLSSRPLEGDLIYFPLGDRLFEIKFVEHEQPFYQLQKNYVYELRCELFRYEDESIDTGIEEIDDNIKDQGYIQTLTLVGSGVTATAVTGVLENGIRYISVTNRGSGYNSTPKVTISSSQTGISAVGVATMIGGIIDCNGTKSLKVQGVDLLNSGSGYTKIPNVVFVGGGGVGAAASAVLGNGVVGIITLTSGGSGYTTAPTVTFSGPGIGVTAKAYAVVSSAGTISQIRIKDAGIGYTSNPTVTISSPQSFGSGTYEFNEIVTGSVSGATARVNSWNIKTKELKIFIISGKFKVGETITGSKSGSFYKLKNLNEDNLVDPFTKNSEIQEESDKLLDFSEKNPFGTP